MPWCYPSRPTFEHLTEPAAGLAPPRLADLGGKRSQLRCQNWTFKPADGGSLSAHLERVT